MADLPAPPLVAGCEVTVLIVNFNAGDLLMDCVVAALNSSIPMQVLIGDNGSSDESLATVRARFEGDPRVAIVEHGDNLGFAAGNNRLLDRTTGSYLLFLNPDCILRSNTLELMLELMESKPDAGMAGCIVRNPDGSEQVASRRAIPDPWIGLVRVLGLGRIWPGFAAKRKLDLTDSPLPDGPVSVDAISGSLMLVRRAALDQVGALDEGYFLHCEDLDWFVRFRRAGWGIYLVPSADAIHYKGACSISRPLRVEWHKHRGMARFFLKHQRQDYSQVFGLLVLTGIWGHFGAVALAIAARRVLRGLGVAP